uniref:hypothetical protein n=1 Tax=Madagascaria erythrocladioides TaxID=753684 RepID=UPI001BEFD470|nr:hypothetical protein MW574_pgp020 [Madagascaria erythrocladioides]QUE29091.1 Ycf33 [Madagascaria erythrocladioides]UNJ16647.1 hypothetical protein [Madagascaria erythrocladioides]
MPTFWENVIRLMRFFLSSVTGLVFIIISPIISVKEKPILLYISLIIFIFLLIITYKVLQQMLGIEEIITL